MNSVLLLALLLSFTGEQLAIMLVEIAFAFLGALSSASLYSRSVKRTDFPETFTERCPIVLRILCKKMVMAMLMPMPHVDAHANAICRCGYGCMDVDAWM